MSVHPTVIITGRTSLKRFALESELIDIVQSAAVASIAFFFFVENLI